MNWSNCDCSPTILYALAILTSILRPNMYNNLCLSWYNIKLFRTFFPYSGLVTSTSTDLIRIVDIMNNLDPGEIFRQWLPTTFLAVMSGNMDLTLVVIFFVCIRGSGISNSQSGLGPSSGINFSLFRPYSCARRRLIWSRRMPVSLS